MTAAVSHAVGASIVGGAVADFIAGGFFGAGLVFLVAFAADRLNERARAKRCARLFRAWRNRV